MESIKTDYLTPKQLADRLEAFSHDQIKRLLANRAENGLDHYVCEIGMRTYVVSLSGFCEWLNKQAGKKNWRHHAHMGIGKH